MFLAKLNRFGDAKHNEEHPAVRQLAGSTGRDGPRMPTRLLEALKPVEVWNRTLE
jgi:hypothetical protein